MTQVFELDKLPPGHTHQLDHNGKKVLLANVEGQVYAVESKCSHFELPLENAALCGHRLRCPFHHACFDVRNGAQMEAPGLDGIATYATEVREGGIYIAEQPQAAPLPLITPASAPENDTAEHFQYAIVGGGVAAANAVYGIREVDGSGTIALFAEENLPPYDRTHVSKALMSGDKKSEELPLKSADFYEKHGVVLFNKTRVETVQAHEKQLLTAAGRTYKYDKILLATGGQPNKLDLPGANLGNVLTIRNARDGRRVNETVKRGSRVTIIGGSFIGLESAMSAGKLGAKVTVITPETVLFNKVFGERVGKWIQSLHEAKGVSFKPGTRVEKLTGEGSVNAVITDGDERIATDLVVVGIGVKPATDYLQGLAANNDGGLNVNNHLCTNVGDTFAAGDIARYPDRSGAVRIEHWKVAAQQGRVAGRNMAGKKEPYTAVPYFWTNQQGTNLRYVGHANEFDEVLFDGRPEEGPFLAFYLQKGHLLAVLGVKRDPDVAAIGELLEARAMPPADELIGREWQALLRASS